MRIKIPLSLTIRLICDATLIALALCFSYLFYIVYHLFLYGELDVDYYRNYFFQCVTLGGLILITSTLTSNAYLGLYTKVRTYPVRTKIWILIRSISLGYLMLVAVYYMLSMLEIRLPRTVITISWCLTILLLSSTRVWSSLWRRMDKSQLKHSQHPFSSEVEPNSVLLIGGAGYIGSSVLAQLLEHGYKVKLLDLLLFGEDPIKDHIKHPKLTIIREDFRETQHLIPAMRDVGTVIHLGGLVGDPACAWDKELTIEVNLVATRTIAEIAKAHKVRRLIFASTCSVYGASKDTLDEQSTLAPVSLYASSKIASERVLMEMADDSFKPVILRFGTIFGLSGRTRFDLVVNLLTAKAMFDKEIPVKGGEQWRPFVHVHDAAKAVVLALEAPISRVGGEIFNVGSNKNNYRIREVGELIHEAIPSAKLKIDDKDTDQRDYRVHFDKIEKLLNFKADWNLEDGIRQILGAIESGDIKEYTDPTHSNIAYLHNSGDTAFIKKQSIWIHELLQELQQVTDPPNKPPAT